MSYKSVQSSLSGGNAEAGTFVPTTGPDAFGAAPGIKTLEMKEETTFGKKSAEELEGFEGEPYESDVKGPEEEPEAEDESEDVEVEEPAEEDEKETLQADADEVDAEDEDEVPADATPRAQKRIRQLAADRKEQREIIATLQAQQQTMLSYFQRQNQLEDAKAAREAAARNAETSKMREQDYWQRAQALGFSKDDPYLHLHYEQIQQNERLQQQLNEAKHERQQLEVRAQEERYIAQLHSDVDKALSGFAIDDEVRDGVRENALAIAVAKQLADPAKAVELALKPIQKSLQKKTLVTQAKKPAAKAQQQMDALVATRGATGGREKGTKAGKPQRRSIQDFEKTFGSKGDFV